MRSQKKKLLFFCFSALIMIGLCIGVFADYDTDRVGTVIYSEPYDLGELYFNVSDSPQSLIEDTVFIFKYTVNEDYSNVEYLVILDSTYSMVSVINGKLVVRYSWSEYAVYSDYVPVGSTFYIYCKFNADTVEYSSSNSNGHYLSCSVYNINDSYDIDIYDNSQDVWSSVVSVVNDATNSVINNDILLLFAAAVPVISFGVGMLIRLYHKS